MTKKFTNDGIISRYKINCDDYKDCFTKTMVPSMNQFFLCLFKSIEKVFLVEDLKCSLKASGVLYILYKLTSWFSIASLLFFFIIMIFTLPFGYTQYKKEIDSCITTICCSMKNVFFQQKSLVQKKLEPYVNKFAKKVKPMCNKPSKTSFEDTQTKSKDSLPSQNSTGLHSSSETFEKKKIN